jgi:hypothetical protein
MERYNLKKSIEAESKGQYSIKISFKESPGYYKLRKET